VATDQSLQDGGQVKDSTLVNGLVGQYRRDSGHWPEYQTWFANAPLMARKGSAKPV